MRRFGVQGEGRALLYPRKLLRIFLEADPNAELLCESEWPKWDPKLVKDEEIELVVQVNGRVRERLRVAADIDEVEAKKVALASGKIRKWMDGQKVKNVVFVKNKLVNIVCG